MPIFLPIVAFILRGPPFWKFRENLRKMTIHTVIRALYALIQLNLPNAFSFSREIKKKNVNGGIKNGFHCATPLSSFSQNYFYSFFVN
jgi:hypothetical protein